MKKKSHNKIEKADAIAPLPVATYPNANCMTFGVSLSGLNIKKEPSTAELVTTIKTLAHYLSQ